MAVNRPVKVTQGNYAVLNFRVINPATSQPYDLTDYSLQMVIKPAPTAADSAGVTYEPTITTPASGLAQLAIPGSDNATAGVSWYRLDVIDTSDNPVTAACGVYTILAA